ncbi:SDR family oxidoreductase [Bacillaceae bacterium S4-13-58]
MSRLEEMFSLEGKVAIVTGGGRGLGRQMALAYADAGAKVMICSRKIEACQQVVKEMEDNGGEALALECNIADPEQVQEVVQKTLDHFGTIDILVNNSGATWGAPVLEMPYEAWQKVMNVNVTGTFLMSQAVAKHMMEKKQGKIINIASVAGFGGADPRIMDTICYNTSKGAVITFTKDLATKLGEHQINVNAIAPGFFPTKMSKGVLEMGGQMIIERTPLRRLGGDNDIEGVAIFLASKASDYMTGQIVAVDGGMSAM